jgi:hypothetical protein
MKKENVYVKVNTEKECKNYRKILKQLGEPISDIYFENFDPETKSHCNLVFCLDGDWTMGAVEEGEKITFGQLIDLLNEPKKIAVKVENEKEFKTLMKYYDSLGYAWEHGEKPNDYKCKIKFPSFIPFENNFVSVSGVNAFPDNKWNDYQVIPFAEFAKDNGVKLPLMVSQDGKDLHDGDEYWVVNVKENRIYSGMGRLGKLHAPLKYPLEYKAFSTKEAALSWIEAQKPKTYELYCGIISDKGLAIRNGITFLNKVEIEVIAKYIQELNQK